ncbi:sec10 [Anaeramoeba flamelloides]|uniref:Sec10 n=1 Tax=Anaeramoeba flamelloides TaxID=1746091 RepID=A0AAV7Z335_9EUKA|nr:sec10 [Anaeramoeba flamelloides]
MFLFEDIDWSKDLDKKLLLDDLIGNIFKKDKEVEDKVFKIRGSYKQHWCHTTKIGRQLENIHKLKLRSTSAIELINYFLHFREKQKKPSTPLFVSDLHLVERANVLIKLNNISKELKGEKNIIATKSIQKSISELQKTMLSAFEDASFSQDHEEMKKYLEILLLFNDGEKCIKTFIRSRKTLFKEIKADQANEPNLKAKIIKKKKKQ